MISTHYGRIMRLKIFNPGSLATKLLCANYSLHSTPFRAMSKANENYYETLGVKRTAKRQEIKNAYHKLAKKYHPDINPSQIAKDKFAKILKAYETLSDSKQRDLYDLENDYSSEGNWKGFNQTEYEDQTQAASSRRRKRSGESKDRHQSQGFWDYRDNGETNNFRQDDTDPYDEFFFTGKHSAQPKGVDNTKGKDITQDIEIDFMDSVKGCNLKVLLTKNII